MSQPTRAYTRIGLTVEWRPELCVHCGNCTNGLPQVFNTSKRPWVDINAASIEGIKRQVGECPSGALTIGTLKGNK